MSNRIKVKKTHKLRENKKNATQMTNLHMSCHCKRRPTYV